MTNKDFNNLIKKLSELDSNAGQEVTMRAVKQAGAIQSMHLIMNLVLVLMERQIIKEYHLK